MSVILMTTLSYKALILQGEIWCWSLLGLKGLTLNNSAIKRLTLGDLVAKKEWNSAWIVDVLDLTRIQLFRERLSKKVQATIHEKYCGCFSVHCSSKKFERMAQEAMDVCLRVLKESNKSRFDGYSVKNSIDHIPCYLLGLSRAHFFRQPFSK